MKSDQVILLTASVLDDVWDAPAFAVTRLDQAAAQHYIELVQQALDLDQKYKGLDALSLFDDRPTWYEHLEGLDRLLSADGRGWAILAPRQLAFLSFPRCRGRIVQQEATTVHVMPDGMYWHGYVKHSTVVTETAILPLAALRQVAYPTPRDLALAVDPTKATGALQEAGWIAEREQAAIERLRLALTPVYEQLVAAQQLDLAYAASVLRNALRQPENAVYLAVGLRSGLDPDRLVTALTHVAIAFLDQERPWNVAADAGGIYERDAQIWQGWLPQLLAGPLREHLGLTWLDAPS